MNTFDEIIQTKAYSDLTSQELEVIQELVSSEEDYNEMKSFYAEINTLAISSREETSSSIKSSLNSVFQAKHPGISQNWSAPSEVVEPQIIPLYNRTWFRVAALLVLSAGVITIWTSFSDNQLVDAATPQLTASTDSVSEEGKIEPVSKEKFPITSVDTKQFTASSRVITDEESKNSEGFFKGTFSSESVSTNTAAPKMDASVNYSVSAEDYSTRPKADQKFKKQEEEILIDGLSKVGMDADLNPSGKSMRSTKEYKPAISTTDLLSLIEPSF
jgi:hypothetical protein